MFIVKLKVKQPRQLLYFTRKNRVHYEKRNIRLSKLK